MTPRVSPTERIRADIDELFASEGDLHLVLEQVARLRARLLLQSALEAEVTEFLLKGALTTGRFWGLELYWGIASVERSRVKREHVKRRGLEEKRAQVVRLLERGVAVEDVAAVFGVGRSTVYGW